MAANVLLPPSEKTVNFRRKEFSNAAVALIAHGETFRRHRTQHGLETGLGQEDVLISMEAALSIHQIFCLSAARTASGGLPISVGARVFGRVAKIRIEG